MYARLTNKNRGLFPASVVLAHLEKCGYSEQIASSGHVKKALMAVQTELTETGNVMKLELFSNYFITIVTPCCQVQHVSDTTVFLTISLFIVCLFYTLKSWHLDFPCINTLCQPILSAGQVGTRA
jgi:hypothetical protein